MSSALCQDEGIRYAHQFCTHIIQRLTCIGDLHDLHTGVHSVAHLYVPGQRYQGEAEDSGAGLVEVGEERGGEFGAGVDAGAEAQVD